MTLRTDGTSLCLRMEFVGHQEHVEGSRKHWRRDLLLQSHRRGSFHCRHAEAFNQKKASRWLSQSRRVDDSTGLVMPCSVESVPFDRMAIIITWCPTQHAASTATRQPSPGGGTAVDDELLRREQQPWRKGKPCPHLRARHEAACVRKEKEGGSLVLVWQRNASEHILALPHPLEARILLQMFLYVRREDVSWMTSQRWPSALGAASAPGHKALTLMGLPSTAVAHSIAKLRVSWQSAALEEL